MAVIISLPDELAKKLQTEADARQQSINELAIDFLERALEDDSLDRQGDFNMLGAQMRAISDEEAGEGAIGQRDKRTRINHDDDTSDFEKIGSKIFAIEQESVTIETEEEADDNSASSSVSLDEDSNQNGFDFKTLKVQLKGKSAAIASTEWLLDPSVSSINDQKYRADLEQWSQMWVKVKAEMKYKSSID